MHCFWCFQRHIPTAKLQMADPWSVGIKCTWPMKKHWFFWRSPLTTSTPQQQKKHQKKLISRNTANPKRLIWIRTAVKHLFNSAWTKCKVAIAKWYGYHHGGLFHLIFNNSPLKLYMMKSLYQNMHAANWFQVCMYTPHTHRQFQSVVSLQIYVQWIYGAAMHNWFNASGQCIGGITLVKEFARWSSDIQ